MTQANSGNGEHQNARRREDHPDWKMAAPRWFLVIMIGVFGTVATISMKDYVESTKLTSQRVGNLEARMARTERASIMNAVQISQVRVDSLRWQLHGSSRLFPVDQSFQSTIRDSLRDAERTLARLQREEALFDLENGEDSH